MKILEKNKHFETSIMKNINKFKRLSKWKPSFTLKNVYNFSSSIEKYEYYRKWLKLDEKYERNLAEDLRIMTYNILAESYAYDYLFPKCAKEDKLFENRSILLKKC